MYKTDNIRIIRCLFLILFCTTTFGSFAGYEEITGDEKHKNIYIIADGNEDFIQKCLAFADSMDWSANWVTQAEGRSFRELCVREGNRTDGASLTGGNFCDRYNTTDNPGYCEGAYWVIAMGKCAPNTMFYPPSRGCYPVLTIVKDPPDAFSCPAKYGNPIVPLLGSKEQVITLGVQIGGQSLSLRYDSRGQRAPVALPVYGSTSPWHPFQLPGFGPQWSLNLLQALEIQHSGDDVLRIPTLWRSQGETIPFTMVGTNQYQSESVFEMGRLMPTNPSWTTEWRYTNAALQTILTLDVVYGFGRAPLDTRAPISLHTSSGASLSMVYSKLTTPVGIAPSPGLLISLRDQTGREVHFDYTMIGSQIRVSRMTVSGELATEFAYDAAGNLAMITWPDGTKQQYHYEEGGNPALLTGITAEDNGRFSTYGYSAEGVAISTEHSSGINRYSVKYAQPPRREATLTFDQQRMAWTRTVKWKSPTQPIVTAPNGTEVALETVNTQDYPLFTSRSQPAGSGCASSISRQSYDANANIAWLEDFDGRRTCFVNDPLRGLETTRVEGLAQEASCGATALGASLPVNSRKVSSQWHPQWRLQTKEAAPKRLTTNIYNGQPDPFNGGAMASCAPSSATLPDGSPIAVLCKRVEQATTDVNGAQGFTSTLDSAVPIRVQQWTYNEYGQVLTVKDPLNNTTVNTYYPDTTADHTMGDLATVTNALNQTVNYTKYNPTGQWLEMIDPNGVVTTRAFDLRQRLKTVTTAGVTTRYDYWPTGLVKTVTLPDASAISYGYDDAHRLTSITDTLGNKIRYTLDNSGNRTAENISDPTGKLVKTLMRVPDALNRIQQITGRN